ncbi:MAG: FAD-dependent monooxygenase, partial [Oscillospiraceae bacterium]|nr:FAD-dependent monooxygenase [Oscillospiraceae bacterium]
MRLEYDVLVIGSGTTGCYFARRMAEKGYKVCVAEAAKAETLGERLAVFHIDKEMFKKMDVPRPEPGDADYVSEFAAGTYYSPYGQYTRRNDPDETIIYAHYPFLVCKLPPFVQRLRAWCREAGVVFLDEAKCKGLLYCKHGVRGAALEHEGKTNHVFARLVADCSGIASVARRCLRKPTKVEGFKIGPRDMMYVLLEYVKLAHPEKDAPQRAEHWAYYKGWIAQTPNPDEAIIGVGANLSYEHAQTCMDRCKAAVQMPEGEVVRRERGVIPYRHPPYSLVDNGFVCLGDAACMNKWVGEGICSSWVGAKAAAEVAGRALQSGAYPTERALWPFNVIYNTTQQADFAYINATAINAIDCTADEMDYEFRKGIVFHNKAMTRLNREYSAELPIDEVIVLVGKVIGGLATRNISVSTLQGLLKGIGCSTLLKAHYQNYPK